MPYKVFATEEVLASADVNAFLMRQVIVTCTSGTRPASPSEGMTIYETDTDKYMGHDGSAWRELLVINPPAANVFRSSDQSISSAVQTTVTFDTEMYDFRNMWTSGQPTRLVVPSGMGGIYTIGGTIEYTANATGARQCILMVNGAVIGRTSTDNSGSGPAGRVSFSRDVALNAGDYIEMAGYQNSGTTLSMASVQRMPELWARRVRSSS